MSKCSASPPPTSLGGRVGYNPKAGGAIALGNMLKHWYRHLATYQCHHRRPAYVAYKAFAKCLRNHSDWKVGDLMSWKTFKNMNCYGPSCQGPAGDWVAPTVRHSGNGHDWYAVDNEDQYVSTDDCVLWEWVPKEYTGPYTSAVDESGVRTNREGATTYLNA